MLSQYNYKWSCANCDHYHDFWVDACDLKDLKFKCTSCNYNNEVNYTIKESELICDVNPSTLPKMCVQEFVELLPQKPNAFNIEDSLKNNPNFSKHGLSVEQALDVWSIHDALHYITGIGFSRGGEEYIRYIEEQLNVGWYAVSPELNTMPPRSFTFAPIAKERIMKVAKEVRTCLVDQS
jgi:hypothetical protein